MHGGVGQPEVLLRLDGVPARPEPDARGPAVPDQHHVVRGRGRPVVGQLLLRRQRAQLLAVVPRGARLRQPVPVRVRRAGQRAEHRGADAQGPGRVADQPHTVRPGRGRPGPHGRVHAVHVLHVPDHRQEGGVLARGRRVRTVPHVRVPSAAHHVHSAHPRPGHVEIRGRQVSQPVVISDYRLLSPVMTFLLYTTGAVVVVNCENINVGARFAQRRRSST